MNKQSERGNVLIYVLIAVALFAALNYVLTKQVDGDSKVSSLSQGKARLKGEALINYASSVRAVMEQMHTLTNVLPAEFDFVKPGEAGYDTAPHMAKIFHPVGGGLNPYTPEQGVFAAGSAQRGWVVQHGTNVEGTASSADDVIFTFLDVDQLVCKEINYRLFKDTTVPDTTIDSSKIFINGDGDDTDFTAAQCATCVDKLSYCVKDKDGVYAFYNVVFAK